MAEHDIEKIVEAGGEVFNFRDPTKESLANKVTSVRASSSATDTNYPSEKAVAVALENVAPGAITTDVTIANGDKMIISDASDSSKMKRASEAFDGSSSGVLLSKKGTFVQPKEAYLEWGGKNISGGYGPIDAAMVGQLGACRTAFGKAAGVTIEYTRDGGETWVDYEASDSTKVALFTTSASIGIGKCDATHKATSGNNWQLYKTRIRILSPAFGLYTNLNKFVILVSTNGSSGCQVVIRSMTRTNEEGSQTWTDMGTATVSGWSGYNVINTSAMTTWSGGASQKSQNSIIEFLFEATQASANDNYNGLQIISIYGYGGVGWTCPSAMAKTGHLYSFDAEGNATFPKAVTAESFTGKFTTARTIGISGPVTGTATPFDGSANITIPVTKVGYGVTNATSAYPFGAASLCGPRSGDDSLPYVQWSQFTGKAFTVGGTTYYGYVLAPSSSVTVTYGGSTATVTNSHATNYNVIIVIEDATYLGSATFTGRDRCAPTLDGVGFRRCNIADNVAVGTGTAVVVNVGGGFTMPSATSNSKLLAAKAVSSVDYTGNSSVASGAYSVASGYASVASGISSVASGAYSVASGYASVASGLYSVASGYASVASGRYSVASGNSSVASGAYSVASGLYSVASQDCSFVSAIGGLSGAPYQTVIGKNNVQVSNAAFVIGWGADESNRKNIAWVGTDGDIYFKEGQTGLTAQLAAKAALNHVHNTDANEVTDSAAASTLDVVTDTTEIVTTNTAGYGNSSTQDKKLYRRPIKSKLWPWIKGLLSSDTGVNVSGSSASCTGNAATATALVDDSGYVHTSGNESIGGTKKFTAKEVFSESTEGSWNGFIAKRTNTSTNKTYKVSLEAGDNGERGIYDYDDGDHGGENKWLIKKDANNNISIGESSNINKVSIGGVTLDFSGTLGSNTNTLYFA